MREWLKNFGLSLKKNFFTSFSGVAWQLTECCTRECWTVSWNSGRAAERQSGTGRQIGVCGSFFVRQGGDSNIRFTQSSAS